MQNIKNKLIVFGFFLLGLLIGYIAGKLLEILLPSRIAIIDLRIFSVTNLVINTIIAGGLTAIPFALGIVTQKKRWLMVTVMVMGLSAIGVFAGGQYLLVSIFSVILTFLTSSVSLKDLYGNYRESIINHFLIVIGIYRGFQIIDEGKTIIPDDRKVLLGPMLVIVRPGNAVVTLRGSSVERVAGPSTFVTKPFEFVNHIYKIGRINRLQKITNVLTKDLVPITIEIRLIYGINIDQNIAFSNNKFDIKNKRIIKDIDQKYIDWENIVIDMICQITREILIDTSFEKVIVPGNFSSLGENIKNATNARMKNIFSMIIYEAIITNIHIETNISSAAASAQIYRINEQIWNKDALFNHTIDTISHGTYRHMNVLPLRLKFTGGRIDLYNLAITQLNLQNIADKIVNQKITQNNKIPGTINSDIDSIISLLSYHPRIIQLEIARARTGSFESIITFAILSVIRDPNIISILQNLSSEIIWAIFTSGLKNIKSSITNIANNDDQYNILPNLTKIIEATRNNENIKSIKIEIPDNIFVEIEFDQFRRKKSN